MKNILSVLCLAALISCSKDKQNTTTTTQQPIHYDTASTFFSVSSKGFPIWKNDSNWVYSQFFIAVDSFPGINPYSDSIFLFVQNKGWQKVPQLFTNDSITFGGTNSNGIPDFQMWYRSSVFNKTHYPTGTMYFKVFAKSIYDTIRAR